VIFEEGAPADAFYVIVKGEVRMSPAEKIMIPVAHRTEMSKRPSGLHSRRNSLTLKSPPESPREKEPKEKPKEKEKDSKSKEKERSKDKDGEKDPLLEKEKTDSSTLKPEKSKTSTTTNSSLKPLSHITVTFSPEHSVGGHHSAEHSRKMSASLTDLEPSVQGKKSVTIKRKGKDKDSTPEEKEIPEDGELIIPATLGPSAEDHPPSSNDVSPSNRSNPVFLPSGESSLTPLIIDKSATSSIRALASPSSTMHNNTHASSSSSSSSLLSSTATASSSSSVSSSKPRIFQTMSPHLTKDDMNLTDSKSTKISPVKKDLFIDSSKPTTSSSSSTAKPPLVPSKIDTSKADFIPNKKEKEAKVAFLAKGYRHSTRYLKDEPHSAPPEVQFLHYHSRLAF
jgi:hypothetical protein